MAQSIAASVVGVEQQLIVAVVDTVAAAVDVPAGPVLAIALLALPWDQVAQRLEHVLVVDVLVLPWPQEGAFEQ